MRKNSKCCLWRDKDKIINHISEQSKLAEEGYKIRHLSSNDKPLVIVQSIQMGHPMQAKKLNLII